MKYKKMIDSTTLPLTILYPYNVKSIMSKVGHDSTTVKVLRIGVVMFEKLTPNLNTVENFYNTNAGECPGSYCRAVCRSVVVH
jgi:hypothetical protein